MVPLASGCPSSEGDPAALQGMDRQRLPQRPQASAQSDWGHGEGATGHREQSHCGHVQVGLWRLRQWSCLCSITFRSRFCSALCTNWLGFVLVYFGGASLQPIYCHYWLFVYMMNYNILLLWPCSSVWCSNGTGRSGAYVTIYAQIERMKVEGIVDLFQYIKLARLQRVNLVQTLVWCCVCASITVMCVCVCVCVCTGVLPCVQQVTHLDFGHSLPPSQDQYTFCHELMVSYLDSFEGYICQF